LRALGTSKISKYEGLTDYMSLQQMQLIRDRLARDALGVGEAGVSADTFFMMAKSVSGDIGVSDEAIRKLISKVDENNDDVIQLSEFTDFVTTREEHDPLCKLKMEPSKVCAIRGRLQEDPSGIGSAVTVDTFFQYVRYTCSDLAVTDDEILDLIEHIDENNDRVIQKEELDAFVNKLIGV